MAIRHVQAPRALKDTFTALRHLAESHYKYGGGKHSPNLRRCGQSGRREQVHRLTDFGRARRGSRSILSLHEEESPRSYLQAWLQAQQACARLDACQNRDYWLGGALVD